MQITVTGHSGRTRTGAVIVNSTFQQVGLDCLTLWDLPKDSYFHTASPRKKSAKGRIGNSHPSCLHIEGKVLYIILSVPTPCLEYTHGAVWKTLKAKKKKLANFAEEKLHLLMLYRASRRQSRGSFK
jgi:hypothetical protein